MSRYRTSNEPGARRRAWVLALAGLLLTGCETPLPLDDRAVREQPGSRSLAQLGKSDFDRFADVQMRENTESLRRLMTKLYKRNPRELRKSTSGSVEQMVDWVFEGGHGWRFDSLGGAQGVEAIRLAFRAEYSGDRVLPFIVGLHTMLIQAHGGKSEFYLTDSIDPQSVYNAARNVEIAAWKLSNARDAQGALYLLTNEIGEGASNLSFEREFGKIIGRLDLYAVTLSEKNQRALSRVTQNLATALFLPF